MSLLLRILLLVALPTLASAAAPEPVKPQIFRMTLGSFTVTALSSDSGPWPLDRLMRTPEGVGPVEAIAKAGIVGPVQTSYNDYLVDTGKKLLLFDAGAPNLLASLRLAGYLPEEVDEIYITHLHEDHFAGLTKAGQRVFPNAVLRIERKEAEFWLDPHNARRAPAVMANNFAAALAALAPYRAAGRLILFDGDAKFGNGIRAQMSRAHTPGHSLYSIESQGQKLLIWGDLVHNATLQFPDPAITAIFDTDQVGAAAEHRRAYAEAAKEGYLVAGSHLAFPGIGKLTRAADAFQWQALLPSKGAFHTIKVGAAEVTALLDDSAPWPEMSKILFPSLTQADLAGVELRTGWKGDSDFTTTAYLIKHGARRILVDAGSGPVDSAGKLFSHLAALGVSTDQISDILLTHLHADHIGGVEQDGLARFANATLYLDKEELAFWRKLAEAGNKQAQRTMAKLAPYASRNRLKQFGSDSELLPGIHTIASHGHTAGHTFYALRSKGERIVFWGDFLLSAELQLDQPGLAPPGVTDATAGIALRRKVFADAARDGYLIAGAHHAFPGFGRIRHAGEAYSWQSVGVQAPKASPGSAKEHAR
jgi:glyoxylase-like metal-dependent hydrolase (beta-lactamase superfamily II)